MSWLVPDDPGLRLRERAPVPHEDSHIGRTGMSLRGRSPLAQTWIKRALFRATHTYIDAKQDHIPVLSRQGGPPLSVPFAGRTALNFSVEKNDTPLPHHSNGI
jgi:hypothetical protein